MIADLTYDEVGFVFGGGDSVSTAVFNGLICPGAIAAIWATDGLALLASGLGAMGSCGLAGASIASAIGGGTSGTSGSSGTAGNPEHSKAANTKPK